MNPPKPQDCVLFIDEDIARFIIAWGIMDTTKLDYIKTIAEIIGTSSGQIKAMETKCRAVGIITEGGTVADLAQKCINGLIAKRIKEFQ